MFALGNISLLEKKMSIREPPYVVCFHCGEVNHAQETALSSASDSMLSTLDSRTQKKVTAKLFQDNKSTQNSCFTVKFDKYCRPIGQRWMVQFCRGTLGDYPASQLFLSFL